MAASRFHQSKDEEESSYDDDNTDLWSSCVYIYSASYIGSYDDKLGP